MDAATIVKKIRALSGITRKSLADLAGVSPSTVGRIERGTLDPTFGVLSRILDATGYQIGEGTIVSVGDTNALAAARRLLEPWFEQSRSSTPPPSSQLPGEPCESRPADREISAVGVRPDVDLLWPSNTDAETSSLTSNPSLRAQAQWLSRWGRAGWVSENPDADDLVTMAVSAGNAAKVSRRKVVRRSVEADGGWTAIARRLQQTGTEYAVSGLVAARENRTSAGAAAAMIYVNDPASAVKLLGLEEVAPGRGVLLIAPAGTEIAGSSIEDGIQFVSPAQALLDAFAGPGREPDKAEDVLRALLAATV